MGFEDVANRMKDRRGTTRGERLEALWTGEAPELPPLPEPVAPAMRRGVVLAAYGVLLAGLAIMMVGGGVLLLWFGSLSRWETRGLYVVIAIGVSLVVKATMMFDTVENTAPLPDARLHK